MNKKAMIEGETGKWILAIIVLAVLVVIVFLFKEKILGLLDNLFETLRFGN